MARILLIARALWATEPARVVSWVVALAALTGLKVADADVLAILTVVVPILLGGEATRRRVNPWTGDPSEPSDDRLPGDRLPEDYS